MSAHVIAGRIRTMDPARPLAEAMAVEAGRILAVGSRAEVLAAVPPGTPVEDLGDAAILPGLIDTHLHMQRGGLKIIHDLGYGRHDLDLVIATMRDRGFEPGWGPEPPTLADRAAALRLVQPLMHQLGFTGIIDPATTADELRGYQESRARGELTMRVVAMPYPDVGDLAHPDVDGAIERLNGIGARTGFGDDLLRVGGIKVYFDGEAMRGQALRRTPWPHSGSTGYQRIPTAEFQRLVDHCAAEGWSVGVHAVGGAGIAAVLDCFAAADRRYGIAGRQWQLIHGYLEVEPESMALAARLGVVLAAQPSIVLRNGAGLVELLGPSALPMNPLRSWLDAGVAVVLGSDGPFFPFDPRELIWSAVTRRVRGRTEPLDEREAITVAEALTAYTATAAVASFAGDRRGTLAPGRYADWVAFDRDPLDIAPGELLTLRVRRTVVGGRTVYEAGA
ncbi:amidohydrolase family protein [Phytohabitans sp. ZYX-F-186]|uniref:Amidohydrolase family protein n=1 Tax=Phytohabitans maris TaxID=3071409 RepID=A0ABU0ZCL0_9ACTN|nr:amidohydrolase family protein [Phytohabitans sp. ZYX-F-186]MDQ7903667.1 amidohydrolase family protein [Phytohabitans sp. ZYX-F-186]